MKLFKKGAVLERMGKPLEAQLQNAVRESRFEKAAELRDKMQRMMAKSGSSRRPRTVTAQDIAWAVSARTGIPVGRLTADQRQRQNTDEKGYSRHNQNVEVNIMLHRASPPFHP